MTRALPGLVCIAAVACQPPPGDGDAGGVDAGLPDAGETDAGAFDAGPVVTSLVATFGASSAPFDRAQHGVEDGGGLYVEAYFGGNPACPTPSSPTPDRTLIVSGLRWPGDGGAQTFADGVRVTLLDFVGTLSSHPFDRAVAVRAVPRWVQPGVRVSFSIDATFDGGAVSGTFDALHCASLDGP